MSGGFLGSVISDPIGTISDVVSDPGQAISNLGTSIDQTVTNDVPGGWGTVAAVAGAVASGGLLDAPIDGTSVDIPSPDLSVNTDLQPPPEPTIDPSVPPVDTPPVETPAPGSDQYSLSGQTPSGPGMDPNLPSGSQLTMDSLTGATPALADMGGGTGLTLPESTVLGDATATGTLSAAGVTAADTLPALGDPNSFINTGALPAATTATGLSPATAKLLQTGLSSLLGGSGSGSGSSLLGSGSGSSSQSPPLGSSAYNPLASTVLSTGTVLNRSPLEQALGVSEATLEPSQLDQLNSQNTNPYMPQNISEGSPDIKFAKDGGSMGGLGRYEHKPEFVTGHTGYYAQGGGTGQSDDIPALLKDGDYVMDADIVAALGDGSNKAGAEALHHFMNQFPHKHYEGHSTGGHINAMIADGEFVFPSSLVTALGGGSNKEGAKKLDDMREKIREHKRSASTNKIPPKAKSPLSYMEKK